MATPIEEMDEESLKALTRLFNGSREEAIERYDEMIAQAKADDIAVSYTHLTLPTIYSE